MQLPRRTAARFLVAILLLSTFSPASAFADTAFSLQAVRYNLTYVAGQLASFFSDLADAIASHIPVTSLTASAAAPTPSQINPPAPALGFLATTTPGASSPPTTTTASDAPQTTIIQQPVIERIVERTVPAPSASGISEQTLAGRLASLKDDLLLRIAAVASAPIAFSGPAPTTPVSTATFAPSQRIDQLTNTAINTPTITGGTISGASVSGYLPLSGGTLSGALSAGTLALSGTLTGTDASFSGTISAGILNVAGLSSQGALIGPYFTATSTTATNSFAGGLTGPGNFTVQSSSGWVGVGTTSPTAKLHVDDNSYGYQLIINNSAVSGNSVMAFTQSASNKAAIGIAGASNGLIAGAAAGDLVMRSNTGANSILFSANAGSSAHMAITSAGSIGIGTTTPWGRLSAQASDNSSAPQLVVGSSTATSLFVGANGNVGIGTASPGEKLAVEGGAAELRSGGYLMLRPNNNSWDMRLQASGTGSNSQLNVFSGGDLVNPRMVVTAPGNVGIGTTTPSAKLEVADGAGNSIQSTGKHLRHRYGSDPADTYRFFLTSNTLGDFGMGIGNEAGLLLRSGDGTQRSVIASQENDLAFFTGGSTNANATERLRITSAGNVGIGTTTPWGKLSITGSGAGTGLAFAVADSANTPRFVIQDNGGVGIGLSSVSTGDKLSVSGGFARVSDTNNSTFDSSVLNLSHFTGLVLNNQSDTANTVTGIGFYPGSSYGSQAGIFGLREAANGAALIFATGNSGVTPEQMRITSTGNVGIGTTTPSEKLEVGSLASGANVRLNTSSYGNNGLIRFYGTDGNEKLQLGANGNASTLWYTPGDFSVFTGTVEHLTVKSSGNVGIGTTSPSSLLHLSSTGNTVLTIDGGWPVGAARLDFKQGGTSYGIVDFDGNNFNVGNLYANGATILKAGNAEQMRITSTGNVGIGTTTPWGKLSITGSGTGTGLAFAVADSANTPRFVIQDNGNVGIGTTSPTQKLSVAVSGDTLANFDTTNSTGGYVSFSTSGTNRGYIGTGGSLSTGAALSDFVLRSDSDLIFDINGLPRMKILAASGNVGIGTTTPTAQLSTTGTVRFSNFGAGTLTTDASGNLSVSSDERLKNIDGEFTRGLADVLKLSPVSYHWNATSGLDQSTQYAGFSAQNVQTAIPEAVGSSTNYLTLADRPILAALVNATKEIAAITGAFKSSLTAWLGSASNGIGDLFARDIYATNGTFDTTSTRKLCITDGANDNAPLCLTKSQLAALLSQAAAANLPPSVIPSATTGLPISVISQAPIIELNGNASSTIELGDAYNDLGARIVAPESDLNLGIVVLLDGATTTAVSIDTSAPGEHTILYTVTSPTTGLTGRAVRTVIVSPTAQSPEPPANDNPFNVPEAENDDATSTNLLIAS